MGLLGEEHCVKAKRMDEWKYAKSLSVYASAVWVTKHGAYLRDIGAKLMLGHVLQWFLSRYQSRCEVFFCLAVAVC